MVKVLKNQSILPSCKLLAIYHIFFKWEMEKNTWVVACRLAISAEYWWVTAMGLMIDNITVHSMHYHAAKTASDPFLQWKKSSIQLNVQVLGMKHQWNSNWGPIFCLQLATADIICFVIQWLQLPPVHFPNIKCHWNPYTVTDKIRQWGWNVLMEQTGSWSKACD